MSEITTHFRTCNLCEAMCGLEIQHRNKEILSIKGDKKDPLSRGHICPKAVALQDIYADPNRLKSPIKRTGDTWESISWEEAYQEIHDNLRRIQDLYAANAVAVYQGNPNEHDGEFSHGWPFTVCATHRTPTHPRMCRRLAGCI